MNICTFKSSMLDISNQLLASSVTSREFVKRYEDLFSEHMPKDIGDELYRGLDELINWTALYVEDPVKRAEEEAFIGEDELVEKVKLFLSAHGDKLRERDKAG